MNISINFSCLNLLYLFLSADLSLVLHLLIDKN